MMTSGVDSGRWPARSARPTALRYTRGVAAGVLALAAGLALEPFLGGRHRFEACYLAVAVAAWFAGVGPSLLVALLGSLLAADWWVLRGSSSGIARHDDPFGLPISCAVALSIILAVGRRKGGSGLRPIEGTGRGDRDRHRILLESIGDGVIVTDARGMVIMVNPAAERLTGWTSPEAASRELVQVLRLVEEGTRAEVGCPAARAVERGEVVRLPHRSNLIARDGVVRAIDDSASPIRDDSGAITGVVVIFRDVTQQRRFERDLKDGEERLRLAIEASGLGHWDYEIASGRVSWSPHLEAMHGLAPGTFEGTFEAFLSEIHEEDRDEVTRAINRSIRGEREHRIGYRFRHRDGDLRRVEGRGKLCLDEGGRPVRLIGVCMDVTERDRAEEESRVAARLKDEFLATLAHELRNPLAPVRTGLEILGHTKGDGSDAGPLLAMMGRQVEHLSRLVDDLIDVSRITRGTIELRKEVVGLASVIDRAVTSNRPLFQERGQDLIVGVLDGEQRIEVDPTRLEQVLSNLFSNAAKYTDPGDRVELDARREGGEVVIRVKDSGIGIAPEMLTRVFEIFVQAERRLDRSQGGLGIGLCLVKNLVEMHGGTIAAHSEGLGRGSEFVIRLPAVVGVSESPARSPGGKEDVAELPRRRVLVVDDNQDAADILARCLARVMGQEVEVAYDGPKAVAIAREFRPEVVLLDIGLPGMDGYEVAERLRGGPETGDALVIALTGWGQEEDRRRSKAAGIDFHLVKPVDLNAIGVLIAQAGALGVTKSPEPRPR